jgi:hypothetical protein
MQTPLLQDIVIGTVLLNAYSVGANCVERFVNYQTWPLIPADSFTAYHKAQQPLILFFVVAPVVIGLLLQIGLVCNVPVGVSPAVPWVMLLASAIGSASTLTLQLPIHAAFNRSGYSPSLMKRLLRTDWIRKAADVVRLAATIALLHQVVTVH